MNEKGSGADGLTKPVFRQTIESYQDLLVWQLGMDLAVACYSIAKLLPKDEMFGLISQVRRAAGSVPANIAEGYGRESRGDYLRFLQIAQGSLKEIETHLLLAVRVSLLNEAQVEPAFTISDRLGRALHRLIRSLEQS